MSVRYCARFHRFLSIFHCERKRKIRKIGVYRFLIPYLISELKSLKKSTAQRFVTSSKGNGNRMTNRQCWQAPDVPAELVKGVICACIREICVFRDFMGLKRQTFSRSLLARHLYTRQLACEPQTGSPAYFSVAVRNGKEN